MKFSKLFGIGASALTLGCAEAALAETPLFQPPREPIREVRVIPSTLEFQLHQLGHQLAATTQPTKAPAIEIQHELVQPVTLVDSPPESDKVVITPGALYMDGAIMAALTAQMNEKRPFLFLKILRHPLGDRDQDMHEVAVTSPELAKALRMRFDAQHGPGRDHWIWSSVIEALLMPGDESLVLRAGHISDNQVGETLQFGASTQREDSAWGFDMPLPLIGEAPIGPRAYLTQQLGDVTLTASTIPREARYSFYVTKVPGESSVWGLRSRTTIDIDDETQSGLLWLLQNSHFPRRKHDFFVERDTTIVGRTNAFFGLPPFDAMQTRGWGFAGYWEHTPRTWSVDARVIYTAEDASQFATVGYKHEFDGITHRPYVVGELYKFFPTGTSIDVEAWLETAVGLYDPGNGRPDVRAQVWIALPLTATLPLTDRTIK